ncbi:hypothetical protein EDB80DRAFT_721903 [Ilyonectria destructans]|nr:hypothetical protein EDB80DRAFT_721903 [Ilyonectria destructans]
MNLPSFIVFFFVAGIIASPVPAKPTTPLVKKAANPKCTGKNEVWSDCGTACPQTCTTPPDTICIDMCQSGCFCKSGYVRNKSGGTCIPQSKC